MRGVLEQVSETIGQFETHPWRTAQRARLSNTWVLRERAIAPELQLGRKEIHKGSHSDDLGQFWRAFLASFRQAEFASFSRGWTPWKLNFRSLN